MSLNHNIYSLVLQYQGLHDIDQLKEKVRGLSIKQLSDVDCILQEVLLRQQVGLYESNAPDSFMYKTETLKIESGNCLVNLILCQVIGYKAWFVTNILAHGNLSNSLQTMIHGIIESMKNFQVNIDEIDKDSGEVQTAIANIIDVVLLHSSLNPSSKETMLLGQSLAKLLSVTLGDISLRKLLELVISKSFCFSALNGLCAHLEEDFAARMNAFQGKLLLVEVISWIFSTPETFPIFQYSVSSVLAVWRNSLSIIQLQSSEFRSSLLRWIENAPQIFLEMLLHNKDFETCIYITERPELLLYLLRLEDSTYYNLFLQTVLQLLASSETNTRLAFLRSLSNFIFHISKRENHNSLSKSFFMFIDEIIQTFSRIWIPNGRSQQGLDHLSTIFTTTKAEHTSNSFLHASFYFLDDIELVLYIVGLIIFMQGRSNESPSLLIETTFISRLIDSPALSPFQPEVHSNLSAMSIWEESINSLTIMLANSDIVRKQNNRSSIVEHNVILLRVWSLISAIEKVTSVLMFSEESVSANLHPLLQLQQSIKFFIAHSMQQLKYAHLFLGTGSLSSIMANKEVGNSFSCVQDMVEDAVSRSIVENAAVNKIKDDNYSNIEEIHKNITVGINLPVPVAFFQWETIVKEVSIAMIAAVPLLSSIQITDIESNCIKDDAWWEISLTSLCTACYTFRESLDELFNRWDTTGQRDETNTISFVDLLSKVYRGYQKVVSQDNQEQLRKIYLKVKQIREAGLGDASSLKKASKASSTIIQQILKEPSTVTNQMKGSLPSSPFLADESEEGDASNKRHRLRHMMSMSSTKKQFASSIVAKKLAEKLVSHPHQSFLNTFLQRFIVASRPTMVSTDETITPFHQPISKLLSLDIQDLLWSLRSEWLELLQVCIKLASKEILSSMNHQPTSCKSLLGEVSFPASWTSLMGNMLNVFSAELVYSATAGVKKTVFENTVEVLYVLACALYPVEQELPLRLVVARRSSPSSLSIRDLSRMLVVLQEVGASADQKLQRALMNLILQLSGSVDIMWKVAIPFIMESCLHSFDTKRSEDSNYLSSEDNSEDEVDDSSRSDNGERDPIARRRKKIESQIEMLEAFLQQKVLLLEASQGFDQMDEAKALLLSLPELEASSCFLRLDESVAESLWVEIFRRFQFDLKSCVPSVLTLDNKAFLLDDQETEEGLCDLFVASEHLQVLSAAFLHLSSLVLSSSGASRKNQQHNVFVLELVPWKCASIYLSLVMSFVSSLSQDVRRILKQITEPIKCETDGVDENDDNRSSPRRSFRFVPLSYSLPLNLANDSSVSEESDPKVFQSPTVVNVSRIPLLSQLIALQDEFHSMEALLLIKHFLIRQQYLLDEKLAEISKQLGCDKSGNEEEEVEDTAKNSAPTRTPPASVARLLGLKTQKSVATVASPSPSKQQISGLKKRQSQLLSEQRKYDDTISKFSSLEEELASVLKKYDVFGISPGDNRELFFCIGAISEMLDALTKSSSFSSSPNRKKRKRMSRDALGENDDIDNGKAADDVERRQKLVRKSLQQRVKGNVTEKKSRVTSRNKVVNAWLGETEGNDAYADLEDFLV